MTAFSIYCIEEPIAIVLILLKNVGREKLTFPSCPHLNNHPRMMLYIPKLGELLSVISLMILVPKHDHIRRNCRAILLREPGFFDDGCKK